MSQSKRRPRFIHFSTTCIYSENETQLCGRRTVLERKVQPLCRQEFYSDVLKYALLDRHLIQVPKLVLTQWEALCPHAADGAVAHELRQYQITVY